MYIIYKIRPKSNDEYCDVIDAIGDFLDRNNIEHRKTEISETGCTKDPTKKRKKRG